MFIYKQTEPQLYTVGHYDPNNNKWEPESDHQEQEKAAQHTAWLNGSYKFDPSNFPTLPDCFEYVRTRMVVKKLSDHDKHCIGLIWAYIEGAMGICFDD